jgi:large conductance mechanosensitive channel
MLQECRDFLVRGNIVELSVRSAWRRVRCGLNSLVNDLIMRLIAMLIGKPDFSDLTSTINDAVFRYGAFITAAVQFLVIAAAVFFFVVKPMNALMRRLRSPVAEGTPDEERRHKELIAAIDRLAPR